MSVTRQIRNLALIGFMGTGKSSIGQLAAAALHFDFVDTDHLIEARAGKSISQIFADHGEAVFRDLEHRVVLELAVRDRLVIAAGGGLPANPANLDSLKSHAFVVCLWATPEGIWQRVKHQSHRPLLAGEPDPLGKIRALLATREPFYRQADALVNTEMRSLREVAQHVVNQFRGAQVVRG